MSMKFTKIPTDTFEKLQLNAGILVDNFEPATGTIGNILGATTGGIQFNTNPEYEDFGEDVDNCPNNMMELKRLTSFDPTVSGTFLTCTAEVIKSLVGAADIDSEDETRVIPRSELVKGDFSEVWWIGDYSDINSGEDAGFLAIHLMNALNQAGFQIQSGKNAKGQLAFEYHGHYSIDDQETVPFEIYCRSSANVLNPSVLLNKHSAKVGVGRTLKLSAEVVPEGATVTWDSSATAKATVSNGTVTGVATGTTIITASITVDSVSYTDTCTVIVESAT